MGRKALPAIVHQLNGNPGHRKINKDELRGVGGAGAPPEYFDALQVVMWNESLQRVPQGLVTGTDRAAFELWCVAMVEYRRAAKALRREGQVVMTVKGGRIQSPFLGIMSRQAAIILRCSSELGFTPAARTRLAVPNAQPEQNGFEEFTA